MPTIVTVNGSSAAAAPGCNVGATCKLQAKLHAANSEAHVQCQPPGMLFACLTQRAATARHQLPVRLLVVVPPYVNRTYPPGSATAPCVTILLLLLHAAAMRPSNHQPMNALIQWNLNVIS